MKSKTQSKFEYFNPLPKFNDTYGVRMTKAKFDSQRSNAFYNKDKN